jgi:hypothetical protein
MTTALTFILYIIGTIVALLLFYYVVKSAVKNGIIEAHNKIEHKTYLSESKAELPINSEQIRLQKQYDNGEITFEIYQAEWKKLN